MSYLVDCALIDTIEDLVDTDCSLRRTQTTCRRWITTWFSALGERTSLPGNLIQETLALPISKLTRSHWPKIGQEVAAISSVANKSGWKGLLAVKHLSLSAAFQRARGASKGLIREKPLGQILIDSAIEQHEKETFEGANKLWYKPTFLLSF